MTHHHPSGTFHSPLPPMAHCCVPTTQVLIRWPESTQSNFNHDSHSCGTSRLTNFSHPYSIRSFHPSCVICRADINNPHFIAGETENQNSCGDGSKFVCEVSDPVETETRPFNRLHCTHEECSFWPAPLPHPTLWWGWGEQEHGEEHSPRGRAGRTTCLLSQALNPAAGSIGHFHNPGQKSH